MNRSKALQVGGNSSEKNKKLLKQVLVNWELYLIVLLPVLYIIIFKYIPLLGAQIAFKKFVVTKGIWGSPWIGFENFIRFFESYQFKNIILNTLGISIYGLVAGFPIPILFAIALHYCTSSGYKKLVQMTTYAPHFISEVVMVGMILQFLAPRNGIVNLLISSMGGMPINFMGRPELFSSIYVWSGIWQNAGWGTIIYLAALSGIDPQQHEAAVIDGAGKMQRILHIDLPGIMPTAVILLILNFGRIMNVGFQKVLLMQNDLNKSASQIIDTYVYNIGIASGAPNYSYATAIGLFTSVISFILLMLVNHIAKKFGETSLW